MSNDMISRETLGLAAEYAVASELCRRGIYAQLTLGNRKSTDLLVDAEDGRMLCIQVKAKQKSQWPKQKGVYGGHALLVLVDYENKALHERPDFYLLNQQDWSDLVDKCLIQTGKVESGKVKLSNKLEPTWKDNYVGMSVKANQVTSCKECWDKVFTSLKRNIS